MAANANANGTDSGPSDQDASGPVRMYIGGLAGDVTANELHERFGRIAAASQCRLAHVELPPSRLTPSQSKGFAYITVDGDNASRVVEEIAKAYHRTKWRGGVLRVERAKPDYQQRLQSEWDAVEDKRRKAAEAVEKERLRLRPPPRGGEVAEMVTSVEFQGTKRTSFEYDEEDFAMEEDVGGGEEQVTDVESDVVEEEEGELEEEEEEEEEEEAEEAEEAEEEAEEEEQVAADKELSSEAPSASEEEEEEEREEEEEEASDSDASSVKAPLKSRTPVESVEDVNARRLAALDEKKRKQQEAAAVAKGFLGKIDAVGGAAGQKITFDDDGEVAEIEDARVLPSSERGELVEERSVVGRPKAVVDWMGSEDEEEEEVDPKSYAELDDDAKLLALTTGKRKALKTLDFDDGEEQLGEEEEEDAQRFALRPEFLGESGKKLFEMQKKFGGDQRFRMDARFIEAEENEYFAVDGEDLEEEPAALEDETEEERMLRFQDEEDASRLAVYAEEMTQERDQALDVLAELYPDLDVERIKYRIASLQNKDPIKEASWMGAQMRYDPRVASTLQYELSLEDAAGAKRVKEQEEQDAEEEQRLAEEKRQREQKPVLVGGDRFYAASSTLSNLFTRVRKNSEDGEVGEAALDGVFSWGASAAASSTTDDKAEEQPASAFKLSSLFSFGGGEEDKALAMGEELLEEEDDAEDKDKMPWHFTQSFGAEGKEDETMPLIENDDTDKEEDDEEEEEEDKDAKRKKRVRVTRSLDDFLAFGRSFVRPAEEEEEGNAEERKKQWAERRKKLTLDFKRKRRDALKHKKKQQQAQRQHAAKRQKMAGK